METAASEPVERELLPAVSAPDPQVVVKARRRRFSAAYKMEVLRQADACTAAGELGALLRREGLYSSHLVTWRRQREEGALAGLAPRKRGCKGRAKNPLTARVAELERENQRLRDKLRQAEILIEVQK
jgi:transposase-like protein